MAGDSILVSARLTPSLYWDFAKRGALPDWISFSRASAASYFDNTGTLQSAGNNVARFDHAYASPYGALGLLIEEARTNLFLNSNAPVTQTITVTSGVAYTISFYGTGTLTLSGALTQTMTGSAGVRTTYIGTTGSTSLVCTTTTLTSSSYPQVELGAFPTSYIPTAGSSVARAGDGSEFSISNVVALNILLASSGAAMVEIGAQEAGSSGLNQARIIGFGNGAAALFIVSGAIGMFNQTNQIVPSGSLNFLGINRGAVSWSPNGQTVANTGLPLVSESTSNGIQGGSATTAFLGEYNASTYLNGYCTKIALWNTVIANARLQANTVLGAPIQ